jgi:hypothetical protein
VVTYDGGTVYQYIHDGRLVCDGKDVWPGLVYKLSMLDTKNESLQCCSDSFHLCSLRVAPHAAWYFPTPLAGHGWLCGRVIGMCPRRSAQCQRLPLQAHAVHLSDSIQHTWRNEWKVYHSCHDGSSFLVPPSSRRSCRIKI